MPHPSRFIPATVVVGLQFGDEGKGQIVDFLSEDHDIVVRVNGGANAGHTVRIGGDTFALHLLPSGVLTPGTSGVITNGVVIDPDVLLKEIDELADRDIDTGGRLFISDRAHLVMPWHPLEDRLRDQLSGIGTTGRGIGPAYADKAYRDTAFRVGDLFDPAAYCARVEQVVRLKNAILAAISELVQVSFTPFASEAIVGRGLDWANRLRPYVTDTAEVLSRAFAEGRHVLVEGAHAAGLDIEQGTWPFVTSSVCLPNGIPAAAGIPADHLGRIVGVVKAYTSRVGAGPFPTELFGREADRLRERGREYGTTTGRPRRIGTLDLPAVARAARIGGVTEIALTGLSVLHDDPLEGGRSIIGKIEAEIAPVTMVAAGPGREQVVIRTG